MPSRSSPLADVAPILANFCAADALRWEGFARLTASFKSYEEPPGGELVALLGNPRKLSQELREWTRERAGR